MRNGGWTTQPETDAIAATPGAGGKLPGRLREMADTWTPETCFVLRPLNRATRTCTPGGRGDMTCSVANESKGSLIGY
jgi:hypothetical protein